MKKQDAKYWLHEEPIVFCTDKNVFRYYPEARRLTVHLPDYEKDGEVKMGKGVSVNLENFCESKPNQYALSILINTLMQYQI